MNWSEKPPLDQMERHAAEAAALMKQLSHPKRLLILCSLLGPESHVGELVEVSELSQSALSQHLAKMREAGLDCAEKRGQMVYYRIGSMRVHAVLSTLYLIYCNSGN